MRHVFEKSLAMVMDGAMCSAMNVLQWRRRADVCSGAELEAYLATCQPLTRSEYYQMPPVTDLHESASQWNWSSPRPNGFVESDRVHVDLYLCSRGPSAPTVFLLHALMSANDIGYRRLAAWFNARGWNAVFPHLPYHYSRTPRGFLNGELAVTANLIRNGEALRQGVVELRQIMTLFRERGCREFGVLGTSYGGWNGALLSFLESDFRFLALVQPIVNVELAIWENPGAASMRRQLRAQGIQRGESETHAHLSSPLHGVPLCGGERAVLVAGLYDRVSPARELLALKHHWKGAKLVHVRQGHFGYAAMRETLKAVEPMLGDSRNGAQE